jgi:hypothetical protein
VKGERLFMTDRFPEAFRRFEDDVDIRRFDSFRQLEIAFEYWAGQKWLPTYKQKYALEREARRIGIPTDEYRKQRFYVPSFPRVYYRHERISVRGRIQNRYRDARTERFIKKP